MNEIFDNFIDLNVLYLIGNVFLQVSIALGCITTLFLIRAQIDEQKLKQFGHHTKELIIEVIIELVVELLIRSFSEGLDDVIDGLSDKIFDLSVIVGRPIGGIDIGH